jgi:colanic acid/amylovoran biosynthesis protein
MGDPTDRVQQVGITAREWLTGAAGERYETALASFIDWLHEVKQVEVTLIPQVTSGYHGDDDRLISRRIADRCRSAPRLTVDRIPHDELRSLYGSLDVLVGTRFHSVIFGLTARTPSIAIEYEHKTSGIMRDLGLDEWVIAIEDVDLPWLQERYEAIQSGRVAYLDQLETVMPGYQHRADELIGALQEAVGPPALAGARR